MFPPRRAREREGNNSREEGVHIDGGVIVGTVAGALAAEGTPPLIGQAPLMLLPLLCNPPENYEEVMVMV